MADNTNTNNNDDGTNVNSSNLTVDNNDPFEKHLNIAIEAQDGKTDDSKATNTESGENKDDKAGDKQGATGQSSDSNNQNNQQQQGAKQEGKKDEGKTGNPRDITLADGTVVKGGAERRFYEQREVARQEAQHWKQQFTTLQQQNSTLQQQMQTLQQSVQQVQGMPPQDLAVATRMYRDMVQDPVGTLKKLLAEATAKGYNIEGIAAGVDVQAITRIVENAAQMQSQQRTPDEAQLVREAEAEWNGFLSQYPDARPHDALIAQMLRDTPSLSLQDAYFSLKSAFIERGLDFSKPLAEQQQGVQQQQQQNNQSQQQMGLPQGRNNGQQGQQMQDVNKIVAASGNASMDDIIKESMREAGMNI